MTVKRQAKKKSFLSKLVDDVAFDFFGAFMSMIFLGAAHGFDHRIPTIGYWAMFFLLWVVSFPISIAILAHKRWNT